ncbi:ABC transporter ATP-binding protein [Massilia sp. DD77]|uniref:ABC transporter ATP-binding protein n=1 Tax=Massilia sp. DD77 TaxID=3109349 RepID=UPI002FFD9C6B
MIPSPPVLTCSGLRKRFGDKLVFDHLTLSLGVGVVALTGENGSGKSTLLSLLCGIHAPDAGDIVIAGHDLRKDPVRAKSRLAFVPDEPVAYDFMTGFEYLTMMLTLKRMRPEEHDPAILERFHIDPYRHLQFKDMSLGTQRKFMLAGGLLGKPAVLLMDEPTNGLDAASKATLAALVNERRHDTLVLFSTHDHVFMAMTEACVLALPEAAAGHGTVALAVSA